MAGTGTVDGVSAPATTVLGTMIAILVRVDGVPVLGGRADIAAAAPDTGASTVIFAVDHADAGLLQEVQRRSLQAGAAFKVVP